MITNQVTTAMLNTAAKNATKAAHAVGEVVMFANETDPAEKYGGTWERTAQGRFPIGTGGGIIS